MGIIEDLNYYWVIRDGGEYYSLDADSDAWVSSKDQATRFRDKFMAQAIIEEMNSSLLYSGTLVKVRRKGY